MATRSGSVPAATFGDLPGCRSRGDLRGGEELARRREVECGPGGTAVHGADESGLGDGEDRVIGGVRRRELDGADVGWSKSAMRRLPASRDAPVLVNDRPPSNERYNPFPNTLTSTVPSIG